MDDGKNESNTEESDKLEGSETAVGGKVTSAGETSKTPAAKPPAANCSPK